MTPIRQAQNLGTVGEIIATRQLYYFDEQNQKKLVTAIVGKPHRSPDSPEFQCQFQIIGIGNSNTQTARGHDSIQALQSALILLAATLNQLNDRLGRRLTWDGGVKGELGFP